MVLGERPRLVAQTNYYKKCIEKLESMLSPDGIIREEAVRSVDPSIDYTKDEMEMILAQLNILYQTIITTMDNIQKNPPVNQGHSKIAFLICFCIICAVCFHIFYIRTEKFDVSLIRFYFAYIFNSFYIKLLLLLGVYLSIYKYLPYILP